MKLFLLTILIFASTSFAAETKVSPTSKDQLSAQFDSYLKQKSKEIDGDVEKDVLNFAKLKLSEVSDLDLVKNVLLTLVKLDETDPSRTTTMMLASSYSQNKKLFQKAFVSIKTKENKATVEEIEKLMADFSTSGNG